MRLTMRQARRLADKTQKEVAKELDVHHHTYMKWEHHPDDMSIEMAKKFARIVKVSFDSIFFDDESNLIRQTE